MRLLLVCLALLFSWGFAIKYYVQVYGQPVITRFAAGTNDANLLHTMTVKYGPGPEVDYQQIRPGQASRRWRQVNSAHGNLNADGSPNESRNDQIGHIIPKCIGGTSRMLTGVANDATDRPEYWYIGPPAVLLNSNDAAPINYNAWEQLVVDEASRQGIKVTHTFTYDHTARFPFRPTRMSVEVVDNYGNRLDNILINGQLQNLCRQFNFPAPLLPPAPAAPKAGDKSKDCKSGGAGGVKLLEYCLVPKRIQKWCRAALTPLLKTRALNSFTSFTTGISRGPKSGLTAQELGALFAYTSEAPDRIYKSLNCYLNNREAVGVLPTWVTQFTTILNRALSKVKPHVGPVYRGTHMISTPAIGDTLRNVGFLAGSTDSRIGTRFSGCNPCYRVELLDARGRYISPFTLTVVKTHLMCNGLILTPQETSNTTSFSGFPDKTIPFTIN
jgi:hypothetical protein